MLVRQAAPDEEPFWSVPSGALEDGEVVTEALTREVLEETGLEVVNQLHQSRGPGSGYLATVWAFDAAEWRGALGPRDPDGFVSEASFVAVAEAIGRLEPLDWQALTVAYLRGLVEPGSLHVQCWHSDGRIETP